MTEWTPREPHTRRYCIIENGVKKRVRVDVDNMGLVSITEEMLDQLFIRAGFTETEE